MMAFFVCGALFGMVIGSSVMIGYWLGMRTAHERYEAAKIAERERYWAVIQAARDENDRRFRAECQAYWKTDLAAQPGGLVATQFGRN